MRGPLSLIPRALRRGRSTLVYALHHASNHNVGDRQCRPLDHFAPLMHPRLRAVPMDLLDRGVARLKSSYVILGGGGLLNPWCWTRIIGPLLERDNRVIAWGIGHHHDNVPAHRYPGARWKDWRGSETSYAVDYPLHRFFVCGVRDVYPGMAYAPCVSCMSPLFDRPPAPRHEVVVYWHGVLPRPAPVAAGVAAMSNVGDADLAHALAFLASGEVVVTNSYHGLYWATLLGRRVLLYEPWCTKFDMFPYSARQCDSGNWRQRIAHARAWPDALAECRAASEGFARQVFTAIHKQLGLPCPASLTADP